eukprot:gnl/MRDRNA2_/MRDRNA2_77453_c0_seq1.p1 gnl/MRDRNA2_/MRDRNA2_77453_c0~~gnl/MRDRNA2_/MRDRNA2_77453_c0_seq1.p1  ORF type:complete len:943 (+),score=154.45 gnl/MRDRNA2_/MRDRNA2_77453_c0_seq1:205-2829(+)
MSHSPSRPGSGSPKPGSGSRHTSPSSRSPALPKLKVTLYDKACRRMGILPKFSRALRDARHDDVVYLGGLGLGDEQLAAALEDNEQLPILDIHQWHLCGNRLTDSSLVQLTRMLPSKVQLLDLSRNTFGAPAFTEMALPELQSLDLTGCSLTNDGITALGAALRHSKRLIRLELNRNQFHDASALGILIPDLLDLVRLGLSGNFISGAGATAVFEGMLQNCMSGGRLADVDISFNCLNDGAPSVCIEALSDLLRKSTALYHLDLSYNSLDFERCQMIADGLKDNHFLFGLHFVGNSATMDANGFLTPASQRVSMTPVSPKARRTSKEFQSGNIAAATEDRLLGAARYECPPCNEAKPWKPCSDADFLRDRDVLEQKTTCWACEGWRLVVLTWPGDALAEEPKAVWAFTSLDGFVTGLRLRKLEGGRFSASRMVPKDHELSVIFQVDSTLRVSPNMKSSKLCAPVDIALMACEELPELTPPPEQVLSCKERVASKTELTVDYVLSLDHAGIVGDEEVKTLSPSSPSLSGLRTVLLDGPEGPVAMPRVTEREFQAKKQRVRTKSLFSPFRLDSDELIEECLETDWALLKMDRVIRNEKERPTTKMVCKRFYGRIVVLYKYLSSFSVTGESPFGVSSLDCSDVLQRAGLVDADLKMADVDRLVIASRFTSKELQSRLLVRNDKTLVRYQFLEFLLRIAELKFVQTGKTKYIAEAFEWLMDAFEVVFRERMDAMSAFFAALHTDEADDVCKEQLEMLQAIYQRFSGLLALPGQKPFMSLKEFEQLLDRAQLFTGSFQQRKATIAFRMGLQTQPDEYFACRFQEMSLLEFLHALGAVAFLGSDFSANEMPRLLQGIFAKLRNLLEAMRAVEQKGKQKKV